jgi:hypothetical protein
MADLWSDYSDALIADIDAKIGSKYKMSIRDLLTDPTNYADDPNVQTTIKNMKSDVDFYIDDRLAKMPDETKTFEDNVFKANSITTQLAQNISMQAKQYKVPFIKPVMIDRDDARDVVVYVNSVDQSLLALVDKLSSSATFIADYTYNYKQSKIGAWLFSGSESHMLRAYLPPSDVLSLETSRDELDGILDTAAAFVGKITA